MNVQAALLCMGSGQRYDILRNAITFGRAASNDVVLPGDRFVSRHHGLILRIGSEFYVEDIGSTHGLKINGYVIEGRQELKHADVLSVGMTDLVFVPIEETVDGENTYQNHGQDPQEVTAGRGAPIEVLLI